MGGRTREAQACMGAAMTITDPIIVGAGRWGSRVAQCLDSLTGVYLREIIDVDRALAQRLADRMLHIRRGRGETTGAPGATDSLAGYLHTMAPKNIVVATGPRHRKTVIDTLMGFSHQLDNGSVRIEKPLGLTSSEARKYADRFEEASVNLTVGFTLLHHPLYQAAFDILRMTGRDVEAVDSVRIGRSSPHDISPMLDLGIHSAAVSAYLERVQGRVIETVINCGDSDFAVIRQTRIIAGGVELEIDEVANTLTLNGKSVVVQQFYDALELDVTAWVQGDHRGTPEIAVRAHEIIEDQAFGELAL